jgi:uncharacterized membrane protein YqgA involved in biofilm formation
LPEDAVMDGDEAERRGDHKPKPSLGIAAWLLTCAALWTHLLIAAEPELVMSAGFSVPAACVTLLTAIFLLLELVRYGWLLLSGTGLRRVLRQRARVLWPAYIFAALAMILWLRRLP